MGAENTWGIAGVCPILDTEPELLLNVKNNIEIEEKWGMRGRKKRMKYPGGERDHNEPFSLQAVFIASRAKTILGGLCSIRKWSLSIMEEAKECEL